MNIQTERLDNHTARLTVEIETERLEKAKLQAAKTLSKRYRIPGFRPGKAPYKIILNYVGEASILEDAIELLSNEVYRDALMNAPVAPYGPGVIENVTLDPPTFVFSLPLQPEVDLGDYRAIRLEYIEPEISEDQVERVLHQLQRREAVIEESSGPIALGQQVTVNIDSEFTDGEERAETNDDGDSEDDDVIYKNDAFIQRHDAVLVLSTEEEPVLKGFSEALVGANAGDDVVFELVVPDDSDYKTVAGRKVQFTVTINKIENIMMPPLDDDLAAKLTKDEATPLTIDALRTRIRENMLKDAQQKAEERYASQILDRMTEAAHVAFPPQMIDERVHDMMHEFEEDVLKRQGLDLKSYQKLSGMTHEDFHKAYGAEAERSVKRSLVLSEFIAREKLLVSEEAIDARIDEMVTVFGGENQDGIRSFLNTPTQRDSLRSSLLYQEAMKHLMRLGKGELWETVAQTPAVTEGAASVEEAATTEEAATAAEALVEPTGDAAATAAGALQTNQAEEA